MVGGFGNFYSTKRLLKHNITSFLIPTRPHQEWTIDTKHRISLNNLFSSFFHFKRSVLHRAIEPCFGVRHQTIMLRLYRSDSGSQLKRLLSQPLMLFFDGMLSYESCGALLCNVRTARESLARVWMKWMEKRPMNEWWHYAQGNAECSFLTWLFNIAICRSFVFSSSILKGNFDLI